MSDPPTSIAVDGSHIYWAARGSIGRANLDGTNMNPNFIVSGGSAIASVAVDSQRIYWPDFGNGSIGRANLSGTGIDDGFIKNAPNAIEVGVDDLGLTGTAVVCSPRSIMRTLDLCPLGLDALF